MTFSLILAVLKSVADAIRGWFTWTAGEEKKKKDAVDKTTSGIGKGKPFVILLLLFVGGCGYIMVHSTPLTLPPEDYQELIAGQTFVVPKSDYYDPKHETDACYFSNWGLEKYVRSKIAEYEARKHGFFHKEEDK